MREGERDPHLVLAEMAPMLSLIATRHLYSEQPELWKLGEYGRARTIEDFAHHFQALASLIPSVFRAHVEYCQDLFARRELPSQWLSDAWRWMARVISDELPPDVAERALYVLSSATKTGDDMPVPEGP